MSRLAWVSEPNCFTINHYIMLTAFLGTHNAVSYLETASPTTAWGEPDGGSKASLL